MKADPTAADRMKRYRSRARRRTLRRVEFQVPAALVREVRAVVARMVARQAGPSPNPEVVNDLAKLLLHRRIAKRLVRAPSYLEAAKRAVETWPAEAAYTEDWQRVLREPLAEIVRLMTDPGERGRRLRNTSPFAALEGLAVTDPQDRRRLWRLAKRTLVRWTTTAVLPDR